MIKCIGKSEKKFGKLNKKIRISQAEKEWREKNDVEGTSSYSNDDSRRMSR